MGRSVLDAGGVVVEILASEAGAPASRMQLDAWVDFYDLHVTTVRDLEGTGLATLTAYGIRESGFVVDLADMRIVRKVNGSTAGTGASSVAQLIPEILSLLDAQRDR